MKKILLTDLKKKLNGNLQKESTSMDAESSYDKYRKSIDSGIKKINGPFNVSQNALRIKAIAAEKFDGLDDKTFIKIEEGVALFSERLVNQVIEYALNVAEVGSSDSLVNRKAYIDGYNQARREFAEIADF